MTTQALIQFPDPAYAPSYTTLRGVWLWLARAFWVLLCAASISLSGALLVLILDTSNYGDWTIETSAALFGISLFSKTYDAYGIFFLSLKFLASAVFFLTAFYIFWRKSDDWLAILVSLMLLSIPHAFNLSGYTENWYRYPNAVGGFFYWLDALFNGIGLAFVFLVFFLFPDGRFVPRWTRWIAFLPFMLVIVVWLSEYLHLKIISDDSPSWFAAVMSFMVLFLLATASQIYRYLRVSSPAEQTQTRIVVAALVVLAVSFSGILVLNFVGLDAIDTRLGAFISLLAQVLVPILLPLSFGVAILRDRLWQSNRALNRAFVYGTLTVILLLIYVLVVGTLSELFRATNNFLIAAVATGIVALLFQPLRERLQSSINRFLYGERQEPFRVLNQLGARLENTLAPDAALPLIVETIAGAMRVPYVAIELKEQEQVARTEFGKPPAAPSVPVTFPLRHQNESIGELVVARRAPNENFSAADLQLLETLARQAGTVAYTARLNKQLRESRERIIVEREQERRRLRRDLHDGLGPTLAGQTLKLDAAMELLQSHDTAARRILQDVKTQSQNTVADIRRIVYELRPPALDDLGLVGALQAHFAQHNDLQRLPITFQAAQEVPPLSAAVQVNAYRIVLEAVNNVIHHAQAAHCEVTISTNGTLHLEIRDDGVGLPEVWHAGVGVTSMRERAVELGGSFLIENNAPNGTRVVAELPLGGQT